MKKTSKPSKKSYDSMMEDMPMKKKAMGKMMKSKKK